MDDLEVMKTVYIFLIMGGALGFGLLPILSTFFKAGNKLASLGACFSGGIFLSVAIADLLPESLEASEEAVGDVLPLAAILVIVGYSIILFLEKVVFKPHSHAHHHQVSTDLHANDTFLPDLAKTNIISAILLSMAFTVHNLFEGIAIGLQKSESGFLKIAGAVLAHHFFAAFGLGVNIKDLPKKRNLPLLMSFVLAEPIGISIGIGLSSLEAPLLDAIFLSLCTGTFLYIACSEIIVEQFTETKHKYQKFLSFFFGCALFITLISVMGEEGHSHR